MDICYCCIGKIVCKSGKAERFKIQCHVVTRLKKKLRKAYFKENLPKVRDVEEYWDFWKPCFIGKGICNDKLTLVENKVFEKKNSEISETFNNYFLNITGELGI